MTNCPMESVEEYNDLNTKAEYDLALRAGLSKEEALDACYRFSRDNGRTPMQWDDTPNAGFTAGTPWLKVNPNYHTVNVAAQEKREDSVLNYYRKLIALRKSTEYRELFTYGDFEPLMEDRENILAYRRSLDGHQVTVMANFGQSAAEIGMAEGKVLLSNGRTVYSNGSYRLESAQVIVLTR